MSADGNGDRNAAMVKLLLENGASVNVKSGDYLSDHATLSDPHSSATAFQLFA